MPRFIAKPIVVEAHQFDAATVSAMPEAFRFAIRRHLPDGTVEVMTGDGLRICRHGNWIVRGTDGDFTVMRNRAFEALFEPHVVAPAPVKRVGRA